MLIKIPHDCYDVAVVGGGHAGIEASLAASRMGCSTILLTMNSMAIGRMSCNPAIGGTAKGHLVREIDALGGEMGKIADATGIQFRMLNKSKGPAVWSPRSQNDRELYSLEARRRLLNQEMLDILEDSLTDILIYDGSVNGIRTFLGHLIKCRSLVLSTGTFLNGLMHTGEKSRVGGRFGEPPARGVTERLKELGFVSGRLKTGTPPRIDIDSIDFSAVEKQESDNPPVPFSFQTRKIENNLIPMYLTYTNTETHRVLERGFDRSPMFTGKIKGIGPRYCPSIEDKIFRFRDRDRHQVFLEPEGYNTNVVYVNGFSTSLPEEIQYEALRTIQGLQKVKMLRSGYAVEYDFFPPSQLKHTLETKKISGLFFAGQINGTSGYEEAAGQGLVAGINSALSVRGRDSFILKRSEAYIGVMIDDLISKSTDEPYRMFTSRAEHRLILRQDNADRRLMRQGHQLGLISDETLEELMEKERLIQLTTDYLKSNSVAPVLANKVLRSLGVPEIDENERLSQLLRRPGVTAEQISLMVDQEDVAIALTRPAVREQIEIDIKYEGYINREIEQIERFASFEALSIPPDFDFKSLPSLSNEGKERLGNIRPASIGQASRLPGVTSSDIAVLTIFLRR